MKVIVNLVPLNNGTPDQIIFNDLHNDALSMADTSVLIEDENESYIYPIAQIRNIKIIE